MQSSGHKRDPARLFLKRIGLLALLFGVVAAASGVWGVYQKERGSAVLRAQAEGEYEELLSREVQLKGDIARLGTDRGMEEALREQYALAERGEGLIVIVESSTLEPVQATSTWERWVHKFLPFW